MGKLYNKSSKNAGPVAWVQASKREGTQSKGDLRIVSPKLIITPSIVNQGQHSEFVNEERVRSEEEEEIIDSIILSMILLGQKLEFTRGFHVTDVESRQYNVGGTARGQAYNALVQQDLGVGGYA